MNLQHQRPPDGFFQRPGQNRGPGGDALQEEDDRPGLLLQCQEWNFPDAPLRGLYARNRVYQGVTGMKSFAPWLERIEKDMAERALDEVIRSIPSEWYADDYDALLALLEQLHRCPDLRSQDRRTAVAPDRRTGRVQPHPAAPSASR